MSIRTLNEFIEWATQFNDGQYLFRGVPNDTFEIQASAYRRLREAERNNSSKLLKINEDLIEKARGRGHDQKNSQQLSDLELLAELQHFGAGTCLIDFTRSALVALWFACLKNPKKKEEEANGKVFAVRSNDTVHLKTVNPELIKKKIDYFLKPDENNRYRLYQWEPKLQNNRIIAQQSVFLFSGAQIEAEVECIIIKSSKQEILESLNKVSSITEASIFPDFDGFARLYAHDKPYIGPDARDYLQRGIEAHQNDNLDDAIEYYTEVIRLDPADIDIVAVYNNRGNAYGNKGDNDSAIDDYTKAIDIEPNFTNAYYNRGIAYRNKGDNDSAIDDYTKAIDIKPNFANAYYNRGVAYWDKGDYDSAIADHTKAIQLNPNYAEAYNNRGNAYGDKGDYDLAIEDYTKAIDIKPNFANAYYNRGVAYWDKGDYDSAIADHTKAIQLNPNYAEAYNNRGNAYGDKGDYDLAIEDYTKAIDIKPNFADAYYNRGIAYGDKGDYDSTIDDYTKAIQLNPNDADVYYNRGVTWLHLREWEKSRADLTTAKEKEADIIDLFNEAYESVSDFETKHGIQLPPDIAAMLTPQ